MTPPPHRMVFVGGLHRSGTSLLARLLGAHPMVSALTGTGATEDEGQHLQSVYPTAQAHGGPGRFAFDPAAHLTEASPLATASSAALLMERWSPFFDLQRPLLLEKSPPNLVRFRFLQAVFPGAACIAVVRHPLAVALATRDAGMCDDPVTRQVEHWVAAHECFAADRSHLESVHVVRYEDLVADPARALARVAAFLGIATHEPTVVIDDDATARHVRAWDGRRGALRRAALAVRFGRRVTGLGFGYSLARAPC